MAAMIPPIADVRAAAERSKPPLKLDLTYPLCELAPQRMAALATLRDFALAVLDAPGMSAERMETIAAHQEGHFAVARDAADVESVDYLQTATPMLKSTLMEANTESRELMREVLRLRAACASVVGDYDHACTVKYDECKWAEFDGVDPIRAQLAAKENA